MGQYPVRLAIKFLFLLTFLHSPFGDIQAAAPTESIGGIRTSFSGLRGVCIRDSRQVHGFMSERRWKIPGRADCIRGGGIASESESCEEMQGTEGVRKEEFKFEDFDGLRKVDSWGDLGPSPQMRADEALRKVKESCSVLLLDFPKELEFGIDVKSWITGPKFRGMKMIPAGIHLMYWSSGHGVHQGIWFRATAGKVFVFKWDESLEDLAPQSAMSEDERERYSHGVRQFDFDRGMAPYPQADSTWGNLTHFIKDEVFQNAGVPLGSNGMTCHIVPGDPDEDARSDNRSKAIETYWPALARTIFYSRINLAVDREHVKGLPPSERAEHQVDSSILLEKALKKHYKGNPKALLGEFQLAFVSFLLLSSFSALEQWKRLISLLCNSGDAMKTRPALFYNFLTSLEHQLLHAPEDWFKDELTQDNFLKEALVSLHEHVRSLSEESNSIKPRVKDLVLRSSKFFKFLESRFDLKIKKGKVLHQLIDEQDSPVHPHTSIHPSVHSISASTSEVDQQYVTTKFNKRMKWAIDGSVIVDRGEEDGEMPSEDDEEGDGPMVVDFVDETKGPYRPTSVNKPLKRGFLVARKERENFLQGEKHSLQNMRCSPAHEIRRQNCADSAIPDSAKEDKDGNRLKYMQAKLKRRQKELEETMQEVREQHEKMKHDQVRHEKAEGHQIGEHTCITAGLQRRETGPVMDLNSSDGHGIAEEVTMKMWKLNLQGQDEGNNLKAYNRSNHVSVEIAHTMAGPHNAGGDDRNDHNHIADRVTENMADEASNRLADELADRGECKNTHVIADGAAVVGAWNRIFGSVERTRVSCLGAVDGGRRFVDTDGRGLATLDGDAVMETGVQVGHDGMHALAGQFVSVESGREFSLSNSPYYPSEEVQVQVLPPHARDSGDVKVDEEAASRLTEKFQGPFRGALHQMDYDQAVGLLNEQQRDLDTMRTSLDQQDTAYIMNDQSDGIVVDMRGPDMLIFGPPRLAQQLMNVSAMEKDYGKPAVFVDSLPPERRITIMQQARKRSLTGSLDECKALMHPDHAREGRGEASPGEARDQDSAGLTRIGELGADIDDIGRMKRCDAAMRGGTLASSGEAGQSGARVGDAAVSKSKRGGELNDYSYFDTLHVSDAEGEAVEEIPMCPRCNFKRAADLEVLSKKDGSVVERLCSVCGEYADDDGTPLRRDPWMLEEPDWFKRLQEQDPKELDEEMMRSGYIRADSI